MEKPLLILCLLIWFPILLYQVMHRGSQVMIIWLFIAPVATNIIRGNIEHPFFPKTEISTKVFQEPIVESYRKEPTYSYRAKNIRLDELLEPTRVIFATFLLAFVLDSITRRRHSLRLDSTERWMVAFSFLGIFSAIFQSNRLEYNLRIFVDAFVIPFIGYYTARRLITNEERFLKLVRSLGYTGFYLIIIGFVERASSVSQGLLYRLQGPFGTGQILHVVVAVAFFVILMERLRRWALPRLKPVFPLNIQRFVLWLAPCIILLTWSRGNWVGFLGGLWIVFFLGFRLINVSRKLAVISLILILGPIIAIGTLRATPDEALESIEGRVGNERNVSFRFLRWSKALELGEGHRLFGIGFNDLRTELDAVIRGVRNATAHNSLISLFVELGAVGLFLYMALVVSIIRGGLKLYRAELPSWDRWRGIVVVAVMADYLLPALFFETIYLDGLSHIYVYVLVGATAGLYGRSRLKDVIPFKPLVRQSA